MEDLRWVWRDTKYLLNVSLLHTRTSSGVFKNGQVVRGDPFCFVPGQDGQRRAACVGECRGE